MNKKNVIFIVSIIISVISLLGIGFFLGRYSLSKNYKNPSALLDDANNTVSQLQERNEQLLQDVDSLKNHTSELTKENDTLKSTISDIRVLTKNVDDNLLVIDKSETNIKTILNKMQTNQIIIREYINNVRDKVE